MLVDKRGNSLDEEIFNHDVFTGADGGLISQLLTEVLALFKKDGARARQWVARARALIAVECQRGSEAGGKLAPWQVSRSENYIRANIGSKLRIDDVAVCVRLSASHFSRTFKATVGVSYSHFVVQERMALAKRLLVTTEMPICEIALVCGLTDQSHLTRLFKRWIGISPRAWRRRQVVADAIRRVGLRPDSYASPSANMR